MSQYDTSMLYNFLRETPEKGLRPMLIDAKFTDVHFQLLMKIARSCDAKTFHEHFEKQDYPRIKFGPAEVKIKEKFWNECQACCVQRGLLNIESKKAA